MRRPAVAFVSLGLMLAGLATAADPEAVGPAKTGYDEALAELRQEYKIRASQAEVEYAKKLDELVAKATAAGDLDAVVVLKAELERLAKSPAEKSGKLPPEAAKARQALDSAVDKARATFAVKAREATSKYIRNLTELEKAETKAGRIDSALEVRKFRQQTEMAGTPGMSPGGDDPVTVGDKKADDTVAFLDPANWEGRTDIWTIEKGVVVGEMKEDPKYNTFFISKKKYSDFELSFKAQLKDAVGNSGVQIRSERIDQEGDKSPFRVRGPQVDLGKGYWGSLYGEGVGGMMKASDLKLIAQAVKETDFNNYYIHAKGPRITIKVNGKTMVDQDFPTLPGKDAKSAPTDGIIAFQAHAGYKTMRVEFKDIKFKELSKK